MINKNKTSIGENIDEQAAENSGVLVHGRKTSAVNGSKNNQWQQGYDSSMSEKRMGVDGNAWGRISGKSGYERKTVSWLSKNRFVSLGSFLRFQEALLRDRPRELSKTDITGKTVPNDIRQKFKNTAFTAESGRLIPLYHWTPATFSRFEKGDVGFHFGTREAALDRRKGKAESKRGADIVKKA